MSLALLTDIVIYWGHYHNLQNKQICFPDS